ncbi:hypothetical protein DFH09DRAFT_1088683 [Mycena vulgaris]|nr:hypothetical protein DFH09DRAFT_1088683 [Mycena vulgaris]
MFPRSPDNNILQYILVATNDLHDVAVTTRTPFLKSVSSLTLSIVSMIQVHMYGSEYEISKATMSADGKRNPPITLRSHGTLLPYGEHQILEQYAQTLQKLHACQRAQKDVGKIKRMFKQSEILAQLDVCEAELKTTTDIFAIQHGAGVGTTLLELDIENEIRHQELLELLSARIRTKFLQQQLMVPFPPSCVLEDLLRPRRRAQPSYRHPTGRTSASSHFGPRRNGKNNASGGGHSLSHPAVMEKYIHRYFISCESVYSNVDFLTTVGLHPGPEPSRQLSKAIVRHLGQGGPSLVVLDNFETPWEPLESRAAVEEFFVLLRGVPDLALVLLVVLGGLPPAVSLMANVAAFEGPRVAFSHATALLSLLSLLPDGISEDQLGASKVPIPDLAHYKSSLLRTSLAYLEVNGRLKSLSPIREYMRRVHPPSSSIFKPLCTHFQDLLAVWDSHQHLHSGDLVPRITSHLGNIHDLMLHVLVTDDGSHLNIAYGILRLNLLSTIMLKGPSPLIQKVPDIIEPTAMEVILWEKLTYEASAHGILGNLSRGLEFCAQAHELVLLTGMKGSDRHLDVLDTQAEIHLRKSEDARSGLEECFSRSQGGYKDIAVSCLAALGDPSHRLCGLTGTFRWATVYFALARMVKDRVATFHAIRCLADTGNRDEYTPSQSGVHGWRRGYHAAAWELDTSGGNVGGSPPALHQAITDEGRQIH